MGPNFFGLYDMHGNPLAPGLVDEVRGWALEFVRSAAAAPEQDYPQELLAALWGVRLTPTVNDKLRPLLEGAGGQGRVWLVLSPPAGAVPARLSLEFPPQTGCRVENLKDLVLTPGAAKGVNVDVTIQPGVVGTFHVPVRWTVEGDGWTLRGRGRMRVGDEWCGRITQWAICGPFPNSAMNALDEGRVHGPERRLDLAARYDAGVSGAAETVAGSPVGWQTVVAPKLDFTERFGPQRSAAAYAVAVLRAKRPTAVAIRFEVPGHGILEPSLNGRLWRVPNHYGRTFSRTLKAGDNILMAKLANVDKRWTLEAWLRMADSAEPGDVEVVPVADFATVAALHPPPRPPIPEGQDLPGSGGVDWKLAYEDDFDRTRLGTDWGYGPGSWAEHPFEFGHGVIKPGTQMYSFLTYARKFTPPFRIEYDVNASGGSVSSVLFTRANDVGIFCGINNRPVGYVVTSGRGGCSVSHEAVTVAESKGPPAIEPEKWCHVTVQFLPPKITVLVNGKPAVEYEDRQWLTAPDTISFMGDAWSLPQIDNVRIYTAKAK